MEITEVRIKLMDDSEDRLRAFCSITIDHCFVVRDLKIIEGSNGPFVAMPSRKLTSHCNRCGYKNHLRAGFCNQCGSKFRREQSNDYDSPQKLYADVAHPINSECRELIQTAVVRELDAELSRAGQPGYRSRYDDEFDIEDVLTEGIEPPPAAATQDSASSQPAKGSPPKPHFQRRREDQNRPAPQERERAESPRKSDDDQQDGFGAGIL
ncbi:Putative septation protein SpoVG [Roseimaritima multifibrata]|uniref:Septation protein SpoVG n=1 Tax=Roseimaritima multifibrata TaxID=1930274 RepID=A0A517ML25_9BACT|nr:SpoVG family protein [Roseimaritima multifibrata]QDS95582.1 Putative septation protein SpoVG [Roseimaritima multifibrata]